MGVQRFDTPEESVHICQRLEVESNPGRQVPEGRAGVPNILSGRCRITEQQRRSPFFVIPDWSACTARFVFCLLLMQATHRRPSQYLFTSFPPCPGWAVGTLSDVFCFMLCPAW